jgi:hypothetical protein
VRSSALLVLLLTAVPATAAAEWRPSGSLGAGVLVRPSEGDLGVGALIDIWHPIGVLRLGGTAGLGLLTSENDDRTRIFMPVALSGAVVLQGEVIGFSVRLRAGLWGGALNEGLRAGPFLGGGAYVHVRIDDRIAVAAGSDVWGLFAHDDALLVFPSIGLVWTLDGEADL